MYFVCWLMNQLMFPTRNKWSWFCGMLTNVEYSKKDLLVLFMSSRQHLHVSSLILIIYLPSIN
uniref:Uncharacterized protein n=1 Tax=Arundo donax TaxID=35708 RepID=A0A0A8YJD7_ARUDO